MKELTVLTVSWETPKYIEYLIRSFERFKPDNVVVKYVIVENSSLDYGDSLKNHAEHVKLILNPLPQNRQGNSAGSHGNSLGLEIGKKYIDTKYTFACHSDILITSRYFFEYIFSKLEEGNELIGVSRDTIRIKALHVSGIFLKTSILKTVSTHPQLPSLDVGDSLTQYARNKDIKHCHMESTKHNKNLTIKEEPYKSWGNHCGMDISLDEHGRVVFVHLGRGTYKHMNLYHKPNKILAHDWTQLCSQVLS